MISGKPGFAVFHEGDEVVICKGTYAGTRGVFLAMGDGLNCADIEERDGRVGRHPVAWLSNSPTIAPERAK